jgi:hypothetical protein
MVKVPSDEIAEIAVPCGAFSVPVNGIDAPDATVIAPSLPKIK